MERTFALINRAFSACLNRRESGAICSYRGSAFGAKRIDTELSPSFYRHIISYQTAIGQALLGHETGETVSLNTEHGPAQFTIVSIQPAPPDQTAPPPTLPSESAIETAMAE
jgi:hypothetical protein